MAETDITALAVWCGITAIVTVVTGFAYRGYKRKKNATTTS
jgi:hypothetical protein